MSLPIVDAARVRIERRIAEAELELTVLSLEGRARIEGLRLALGDLVAAQLRQPDAMEPAPAIDLRGLPVVPLSELGARVQAVAVTWPVPAAAAPASDAAPPEDAPEAEPEAPAETGKRWTEERKAVLRDMYPRGILVDTILAALHALPGPEIPRKAVAVYAITALGLRRPVFEDVSEAPVDALAPLHAPEPATPPELVAAAAAPQAPAVAADPHLLEPAARQVIADRGDAVLAPADIDTVRDWLCTQLVREGMKPTEAAPRVNGLDARQALGWANQRRRVNQLTPFALVPGR